MDFDKYSKTKLWSGIEISCLLKSNLVHIIGLDIDVYSKPISIYSRGESVTGKYLQCNYVVNSIHEAGGTAILAHPARYRTNFTKLIEESVSNMVDGAEAWYDYERKETWKPSPFICDKIDLQLKSLCMLSSCGTDSHGFSLNGR